MRQRLSWSNEAFDDWMTEQGLSVLSERDVAKAIVLFAKDWVSGKNRTSGIPLSNVGQYINARVWQMVMGKLPKSFLREIQKWDYDDVMTASRKVAGGNRYTLAKDLKTKVSEFRKGEEVYVTGYTTLMGNVWVAQCEASDSRRLKVPLSMAFKTLIGFPKPPSMATMERWMDDGVAKAVDGSRVEPDGTSPSGAPSWLLVEGVI